MTKAEGAFGTLEYVYTDMGNMTRKGDLTLDYKDSLHPYAVTKDSNGNEYKYDSNGNMVERKGKRLEYNANNELIRIYSSSEDGANVENTYKYSYTGQRVIEFTKDGTKNISVNKMFEIAEDASGNKRYTKLIYGKNGEVVAQHTTARVELRTVTDASVTEILYAANSVTGAVYKFNASFTNFMQRPVVKQALPAGGVAILLLVMLALAIHDRKEVFANDRRVSSLAIATVMFVAILTMFTGCDFDSENYDDPWNEETTHEGAIHGIPEEGMCFYHYDYTGNTSYLTNGEGEVVSRYCFKPYEEIFEKIEAKTALRQFNKQELDEDTGLHYFNARFYDSAIGRFISADTIVPDPTQSQSYNRYMFVNGNLIMFVDPSGHVYGDKSGTRANSNPYSSSTVDDDSAGHEASKQWSTRTTNSQSEDTEITEQKKETSRKPNTDTTTPSESKRTNSIASTVKSGLKSLVNTVVKLSEGHTTGTPKDNGSNSDGGNKVKFGGYEPKIKTNTTLTVENHITGNIDLGNGKKGMTGWSRIIYKTAGSKYATPLYVENIRWYEGAGGRPIKEPYEHPQKAGTYLLKYIAGGGLYTVKSILSSPAVADTDYEDAIFVHPGKNVQGCTGLGYSATGDFIFEDLQNRLQNGELIFHKVSNIDHRNNNGRQYIPTYRPYPWQEDKYRR